jgi:sulfur-oxidizing protein SoxY
MFSRRACLAQLAVLHVPAWALAEPPGRPGFEAKTVQAALKALGLGRPMDSQDVRLQIDELSENAAKVPVTFSCSAPGIKRWLLLVEKNPVPLSAVFDVMEGVGPKWLLPVKMAQSSDVMAVAVLADGRVLWARQEVRVTLGGCAADETPAARSARQSPLATRIRIQMNAQGQATVRALFAHDMESGQRKDADGQLLPARHITEVTAWHQGRVVWAAQWGASVSRNPLLQFTLDGVKLSDRLRLSWVDTLGDTRTDEVVVSQGL